MNTSITATGSQDIEVRQMDFSAAYVDFVTWIDRGPKTTRTYLSNLRSFAAWLSFSGISAPTREDIISYRQWLSEEHDAISYDAETGWRYRTDAKGHPLKVKCSPVTVKEYVQTVRQFFKWTASTGLYPDVSSNIHPPKIKTDTHRKDHLNPEDVAAIGESISKKAEEHQASALANHKDTEGRVKRAEEQDKRLRAMYMLAVTAGLRTVELHRADVGDIEVKGGRAWIFIQGKGCDEKIQKKAISNDVYEAITDYLNCRESKVTKDSPLFVSTGNRSGGKRIATTTISTMLKTAMKEAGYNSKKLTPHSLRHTAAYTALRATNKNQYLVTKYMRHSDPKTTMIYLNSDEDTELEEIEIAEQLSAMYRAAAHR